MFSICLNFSFILGTLKNNNFLIIYSLHLYNFDSIIILPKIMKLKENLKYKIDKLDSHDLRIVERLVDTLSGKKKARRKRPANNRQPYLDVIELLGCNGLTSDDIHNERKDRV
jgi:hypothetical protein